MDETDLARRPADFPLVTQIHPRYRDVDPLRHLNNVAQASYYEEGVMALHRRAFAGVAREPGNGVVFQVTTRYLSEGAYPDPLQLCGGVIRLGRTSYEFGQALFQNDRLVSVCNIVVVYTRDGRSSPVPEPYRQKLSELLMTKVD